MRSHKFLLCVIGLLVFPIVCEAKDKDHIPEIESCEIFVNKYMKRQPPPLKSWKDPDSVMKSMREHQLEMCRAAHGDISGKHRNISLARVQMGDMYKYFGEDTVARLWYISAYKHEKNHPIDKKSLRRFNTLETAYKLGMTYKDFPHNYDTAFEYFLESANSGGNYAQYELGLAYKNGAGTIKNYVESYAWLNICASNSSSNKIKAAKAEMEILESIMTPNAVERAQELSKQYYEDIYPKK